MRGTGTSQGSCPEAGGWWVGSWGQLPPRLEKEIREWSEQRGQRTCEVEKNWDQGQALDAVMVREPWRWRSLHRLRRSDSLGKREEPARGGGES